MNYVAVVLACGSVLGKYSQLSTSSHTKKKPKSLTVMQLKYVADKISGKERGPPAAPVAYSL